MEIPQVDEGDDITSAAEAPSVALTVGSDPPVLSLLVSHEGGGGGAHLISVHDE